MQERVLGMERLEREIRQLQREKEQLEKDNELKEMTVSEHVSVANVDGVARRAY